ncbi:aspartate/glutamate racemase family protein [Bacillus shivajii]|uniref:aspartate/glutamate racemase family protein n=1 Tax=Bacillus shivajii TaxID=1983719 RepID=UPI001CFB6BBD|nr:aspartate/glutamate racemase family protein [Bacillus shivajii]UCZ54239.1 aspartate/glutamate racemase family protein [Bacillus shivajii]
MRKIGLIGGMSWESTQTYYRKLNEEVKRRKGGLHSAECILYSVDFSPIEKWQREGKWKDAGLYLAEVAKKLELAGAEAVVLCTNTMHKVSKDIEERISVPFLHIADATAERVLIDGGRDLLLLGTRYTMEQPFLIDRLEERRIRIHIPKEEERIEINRIIFDELCLGKVNQLSKNYYADLLKKYTWLDGVILGCTELNMLCEDESQAVYDTTDIHIEAALSFMLQ